MKVLQKRSRINFNNITDIFSVACDNQKGLPNKGATGM